MRRLARALLPEAHRDRRTPPEPAAVVHGTGFRIIDGLWRGLRLRCPCCGEGRLYASTLALHERCQACGEAFEREPGGNIGSVYVTLLLTAAIVLPGFALTHQFTAMSAGEQMALWVPVAALASLLLHRFAKGLWIGLVFLGEGRYLDWPNR